MLLSDICEKLLDNADMSLSYDAESGEITIEFYPASGGVIFFYCKDFSRLNFRKSPEDIDCIFVGQTRVTIKEEDSSIRKLYIEDCWQNNQKILEPVAHIEIDGGSMLSIVCQKFRWKKDNGEIQIVL